MRRTRSTLVSLAAAGALLAACGGDSVSENLAEKALEQAGGGDVDINSEDGSFSVENEDGSFSVDEEGNLDIETDDGSFSSSGDLPEGFPDDVPLPDGFELQQGSKSTDGDQTIYTVFGTVDGDPADVFADIVAQYEDAGYDVQNKTETNSNDDFMGGAGFVNDDHTVSMSVFGDGAGQTTVSLNVAPPQ